MLSHLALMVQAAGLNGLLFGLFSPFDDGGVTPKVGIGWCDVADTLVIAFIIVMIDEVTDLVFEIAG
jgi:hypothetical protein